MWTVCWVRILAAETLSRLRWNDWLCSRASANRPKTAADSNIFLLVQFSLCASTYKSHRHTNIAPSLSHRLHFNKSSGDRLAATYMGQKLGGSWAPYNTMSPGLRPTSVPNGILIHPAVSAQYTWPKIGCCATFRGELGPHLTHSMVFNSMQLVTVSTSAHNLIRQRYTHRLKKCSCT